MKWSLFSLIAGVLITGNILVHAQSIPNGPSTAAISSVIPDGVLNTLNTSPEQVNKLPRDAQQQLARQQASLRDSILRQGQDQIAAARGGITMPSAPSVNSSTPESNSPQSSEGTGQAPLTLSRSYSSDANTLNQANIAQTLSLATAADIRLWKSYYESEFSKLDEAKRSYERIRDSLRRYKNQLDSMLGQLPTTILSCTR